jgi:hypothetical protein
MSGAPGYWIHETTGVLRPAVQAYLFHEPMTEQHIAAMLAYLRQWIESSAWDANPFGGSEYRDRLAELRAETYGLTSREAIDSWLAKAESIGIDPL